MYYTGTKQDFEKRLHSGATGMADIFRFQLEGTGFLFSGFQKARINQEFRHTYYELGGRSGLYMSGNYI